MTICIAAICDDRKAVVVASDRMVTGRMPPIEFDHRAPKISKVSERCAVLSAGNALAHTLVVSHVKETIGGKTNPSVGMIAELLRETYEEKRRQAAEWLHLKPRGMNMKSFYEGQIRAIPSDLGMMIDNRIMGASFHLDLIVAGVDDDGAHIFGIRDPGVADCYDSLGFHAIGSGMEHAIPLLALNYDPNRKQGEMLQHVFDVKKTTEIAPGVGKSTDMVIITSREYNVVDISKLETKEK